MRVPYVPGGRGEVILWLLCQTIEFFFYLMAENILDVIGVLIVDLNCMNFTIYAEIIGA